MPYWFAANYDATPLESLHASCIEERMSRKRLSTLKRYLQEGNSRTLEQLAAELMTKLVDVRFAVAKSGSQNGADAGTSGRAGRALRLECKRYADTSPLDDRNLQGEIDDSLKIDGAMEAWILVSTRGVSQQTEDALRAKAQSTGVPVVVIDWPTAGANIPTLAALCAWAPEVVSIYYGTKAGAVAAGLLPESLPIVERLKRELSPWAIGYAQLQESATARIDALWNSAAESKSSFGQNVAAGTVAAISRHAIFSALDAWWDSSDGAVVLHGAEGMGKTWAAVQWIKGRLGELPVTLMMPSSSFKDMRGITIASIAEFIGNALHDLNPGTNRRYWHARVERLFQRPLGEGAALLLVLDGANQEPSFEWERFLQFLEANVFRGRVRLLVTTQTHYLRERLHDLRKLSYPVAKIEIGPYDLSHGGEFDSLLSLHGLTRKDLPSGVIELARTPRLLTLVLRLRADASLRGDVTPDRLLWAHARDELGMKDNASMSEVEWSQWLQNVATRYLNDISADRLPSNYSSGYSARELGDMVRDPAGSPDETARRLYEIVSGAWLESMPGRAGRFRPTKATLHLALGIAVLGALEFAERQGAEEAQRVLDDYLDPVRATSAAAQILASALSVLVDRKWSKESVVPRIVLSALLQSQNASDDQRQHAVHLAPLLVEPLLHVIEESRGSTNASARHWALTALHSIPSANKAGWTSIVDRTVDWIAHASCPTSASLSTNDEASNHQARRLVDAIGTAAPGVHRVFGVPVRLHEEERDNLGEHVPQLFLGKPLTPAIRLFVAAAVVAAITHAGKVWSGLKWLLMLNPVDRAALQDELYLMSKVSYELTPEAGVSADLQRRVGELLLWLTGDEALESEANHRQKPRTKQFSYVDDYLRDPVRSFFALEHRHLHLLWADAETETSWKLKRAGEFLVAPDVLLPASVEREVVSWEASLNVDAMHSTRSYTRDDCDFDDFLRLASRASPRAVSTLITRWFHSLPARQDERRRWAMMKVPHLSLLIEAAESGLIQTLRLRRPTSPASEERFILLHSLQGEFLHASIDTQLDLLVSEQSAFISIQLADAFRAPSAQTVPDFVHRWGLENARAVEVLCNYLWRYPTDLADSVFDQLAQHAMGVAEGHQTLAIMALSRCQPHKFGQFLRDARWRATPAMSEYAQEAGSHAVLAASSEISLVELAEIVAPWCLLDEALRRGGTCDDLATVAQVLDRTMLQTGTFAFPTVASISVDTQGRRNAVSIEPSGANDEPGFGSFDPEVRWERDQAARQTGTTYLQNAKSAGAAMATRVVSLEAAHALVDQCPDMVSRWLDGIDETNSSLVLRVNLAGGLFLSICEALLHKDPLRGAQLWRFLRDNLRIAFTGIAGIEELTLMLFRVPHSAAVLALRANLFRLQENVTDAAYLDLTVAAISQGASAWLESWIAADEVAAEPLRRKRAVMIRGYLPTDASFRPHYREGDTVGSWDWVRNRAQKMRNRSAAARYWWRSFLQAPDMRSAFCAWQVFLTCADKMAWAWMDAEIQACVEDGELWRRKMLHLSFNTSELKSALADKSTKGSNTLDRHLLSWDSPASWFVQDSLSQISY